MPAHAATWQTLAGVCSVNARAVNVPLARPHPTSSGTG